MNEYRVNLIKAEEMISVCEMRGWGVVGVDWFGWEERFPEPIQISRLLVSISSESAKRVRGWGWVGDGG